MRLLKQLLYGSFYLVIWGAIGFGIYHVTSQKEIVATCFDNIQNQDEIEVDCSAVGDQTCITCELKKIQVVHGEVKVLPVSDNAATLVLEISNPSMNYGLRKFDYTLEIFSKFGPSVRKIPRFASLYPGEKKFIVESGIDINPNEIGNVVFTVINPNWEKASELGTPPPLQLSVTSISDAAPSKVVQGRVQNTSAKRIDFVIIAALGYDTAGDLYRAATAELKNLEPGLVYDFKIFLPQLNYSDIKVVTNVLP